VLSRLTRSVKNSLVLKRWVCDLIMPGVELAFFFVFLVCSKLFGNFPFLGATRVTLVAASILAFELSLFARLWFLFKANFLRKSRSDTSDIAEHARRASCEFSAFCRKGAALVFAVSIA